MNIEQKKADNLMVVAKQVSKHGFFNLKDIKPFGTLILEASQAETNNVESQIQTTLQKLEKDGIVEGLRHKGIRGMYRIIAK
jgi:hypothetical protein